MTKERLEAIEKTLTAAKELGDAERQLLLIWLEETDAPFEFRYMGGFDFDHVQMNVADDNEIVGFSYDIDQKIDRECDEGSGDYVVNLFGFEFWHHGVTWANEDAWGWDEWGEGEELEEALNGHAWLKLPHIEEYLDEVRLDKGYVRKAIEDYRRRLGWPDLHFFVRPDGKFYVYAVDENHFDVNEALIDVLDDVMVHHLRLRDAVHDDLSLREHENSRGEIEWRDWTSYEDVVRDLCERPIQLPRVPLMRNRPKDSRHLELDEAVELLSQSGLPFQRC